MDSHYTDGNTGGYEFCNCLGCQEVQKQVPKAIDAIIAVICDEIEGMQKDVSIHECHSFDENYCYNCCEIIDDEEISKIGNSRYNCALTDLRARLEK